MYCTFCYLVPIDYSPYLSILLSIISVFFWGGGVILTASHACLHVLQILPAKLTNNLQNTKLPASYSRFTCKICRFYDEKTPNHILQGAVSLFSKKKRIARPCGLGLSLERLKYIIRWVNLNCDRTSLFSKFKKGMYKYMG